MDTQLEELVTHENITIHNEFVHMASNLNYTVDMLAQRQTQGSAPRVHQQALTTSPFNNTCKEDVVSPKEFMRGLQDIDVYNQREDQVDLTQEQHNIHISLISLDIFFTSTYQI
jgi:hypothetical protein